jgi:hypothetical protein
MILLFPETGQGGSAGVEGELDTAEVVDTIRLSVAG